MNLLIDEAKFEITPPERKTAEEKLAISRQLIDTFKNESGEIKQVNFCRWCLKQRVLESGDICHICADNVEKIGLRFKEKDGGFPWQQLFVAGFFAAITALILLKALS